METEHDFAIDLLLGWLRYGLPAAGTAPGPDSSPEHIEDCRREAEALADPAAWLERHLSSPSGRSAAARKARFAVDEMALQVAKAIHEADHGGRASLLAVAGQHVAYFQILIAEIEAGGWWAARNLCLGLGHVREKLRKGEL